MNSILLIFTGLAIIIVLFFLVFRKKKVDLNNSQQTSLQEDIIQITIQNVGNNKAELDIKLNEEELIKRIENNTLQPKKERKKTPLDIVDFYGQVSYSPNKEYSIVYVEGHEENGRFKKGKIALVKGESILYQKKLERPNDCQVSNDGVIICCDWLNLEGYIGGKVLVIDNNGEELFSTRLRVNLGTTSISKDGTIAIFEAYYSRNKISVIDIKQKKIIHSFQCPLAFTKAEIDTEKQIIKLISNSGETMEIYFNGKKVQ